MLNLKIAILGANSHIAKGLINNFLNEKSNRLYLYTRSPGKCKNFLSTLPIKNKNNCLIEDDYNKFLITEFDVIINCIGARPTKKESNYYEWFAVTERYDGIIINNLFRNPETIYINFSSGVAYGSGFKKPVSLETECKLNINDLSITDFYKIAKINSEAKHRSLKNLNIIDIRIFSYFSRFIGLNTNFFLCDLLQSIKKDTIFVTGKEDIARDYIHPSDLFSLIKKIIIKKDFNNVYDAYSKKPISKFQLIEYFKKNFNLNYEVRKKYNDSSLTGFKKKYYTTNKKAKNIGYKPKYTSLQCIIEETKKILA